MTLLRKIQEQAIDGGTDLSSLLRSCTVLGARLGNQEFRTWVSSELNGYREAKYLPEYRVISVRSKANFSGPFGSGLRNGDIPPSMIPAKFRDALYYVRIQDPVASIQDLVRTDQPALQAAWPPEIAQFVGSQIYEHLNCIQAWQTIPRNALVAVLDAVRNRLLEFAIEIEAREPEAGEAAANSEPLPQPVVTKIFNTVIMGDVQNMSAGAEHVEQTIQNITESNFQSLAQWLRDNEVEEADVESLKLAIDEDKAIDVEGIGPRVSKWKALMQKKAGEGSWAVGKSVAGSLLGKALATYFGIGT